jgi:hypothetical protein
MVAKITTGKNIRGILVYNESKVKSGEANLILSSGFAVDIDKITFDQKLHRFQHLMKLKPSVKTNAVHISLNFHSAEKLEKQKIQQIGMAYLERIGFGEQPYLVYQHFDSAHQHIHLVTTNIQRTGQSINLHNIGRTLSEDARKSIEQDFNLLVAEQKMQTGKPVMSVLDASVLKYGKAPTKRALSNCISSIMTHYNYGSFPEFNAVLKCFNVEADRGDPGTLMSNNKGLQYSILDSQGKKIGVPLKASSFYCKPTLNNLEKRYPKNKEVKAGYKKQLVSRIQSVIQKYESVTEATFISELAKQGVALIPHISKDGLTYGITFVDHHSKSVFKGSDLGKDYSIATLRQSFGSSDDLRVFLNPVSPTNYLRAQDQSNKDYQVAGFGNEIQAFLNSNHQSDDLGMLKKRKKKRSSGQQHKF